MNTVWGSCFQKAFRKSERMSPTSVGVAVDGFGMCGEHEFSLNSFGEKIRRREVCVWWNLPCAELLMFLKLLTGNLNVNQFSTVESDRPSPVNHISMTYLGFSLILLRAVEREASLPNSKRSGGGP
jgi:hypothetical protein